MSIKNHTKLIEMHLNELKKNGLTKDVQKTETGFTCKFATADVNYALTDVTMLVRINVNLPKATEDILFDAIDKVASQYIRGNAVETTLTMQAICSYSDLEEQDALDMINELFKNVKSILFVTITELIKQYDDFDLSDGFKEPSLLDQYLTNERIKFTVDDNKYQFNYRGKSFVATMNENSIHVFVTENIAMNGLNKSIVNKYAKGAKFSNDSYTIDDEADVLSTNDIKNELDDMVNATVTIRKEIENIRKKRESANHEEHAQSVKKNDTFHENKKNHEMNNVPVSNNKDIPTQKNEQKPVVDEKPMVKSKEVHSPDVEMNDMYKEIKELMDIKNQQLSFREETLNQKDALLKARETKVEQDKIAASNMLEEVKQKTEFLELRSTKLDAKEKELHNKETSLEKKECDILKNEQNLKSKEKDLSIKDDNVSTKLNLLKEKEQAIKAAEDLQKAMIMLETELSAKEHKLELRENALQLERESLDIKIQSVEERIRIAQEASEMGLSIHASENVELEEKNKELKSQLTQCKDELKQLQTEYESLQEEYDKLKNNDSMDNVTAEELETAKKEISQLQMKVDELTQKLEESKSSEVNDKVLQDKDAEINLYKTTIGNRDKQIEDQKKQIEELSNKVNELTENMSKMEEKKEVPKLFDVLKAAGFNPAYVDVEGPNVIQMEIDNATFNVMEETHMLFVTKNVKKKYEKKLLSLSNSDITALYTQNAKQVVIKKYYNDVVNDINNLRNTLLALV